MTPEQQAVYDLVSNGMSIGQAADSLGINRVCAKSRYRRAKRWAEADPAAKVAASVAGSNAIPHSFWIKTDTHSTYYKTPQEAATSVLDDIEDRFKAISFVPLVATPTVSDSNLMAVYALADIHLGLRAWGEETGVDYDTEIARDRVVTGMNGLVSATPPARQAVIVAIGDSLHANDQTNMTPASKHVLDVDTRHYKTIDVAIDMFASSVDLAMQRHQEVTFCILPGNHDKDAYLAILFAMRERYRFNDRVKVIASPMEFFVHEFGKVMIACHHGDKAKANRLVLDAADRWPEMWGRTRFRFYFTGHLHHHKSEDIGGMQWEQLRAVTAKDSYASSHSYSAKSQVQSIVFHREKGEVARYKVGL